MAMPYSNAANFESDQYIFEDEDLLRTQFCGKKSSSIQFCAEQDLNILHGDSWK
jgi:hypothetical protein